MRDAEGDGPVTYRVVFARGRGARMEWRVAAYSPEWAAHVARCRLGNHLAHLDAGPEDVADWSLVSVEPESEPERLKERP